MLDIYSLNSGCKNMRKDWGIVILNKYSVIIWLQCSVVRKYPFCVYKNTLYWEEIVILYKKPYLPNSHIFFKSAVKDDQSFGTAKNGKFVAVPDKLKERFNDVSPSHWRVQAVTFDSTLIISVYLPTDPGTIEYNDHELGETLEFIKNVLESNPGRDFSGEPGIQAPRKSLKLTGNPWWNTNILYFH